MPRLWSRSLMIAGMLIASLHLAAELAAEDAPLPPMVDHANGIIATIMAKDLAAGLDAAIGDRYRGHQSRAEFLTQYSSWVEKNPQALENYGAMRESELVGVSTLGTGQRLTKLTYIIYAEQLPMPVPLYYHRHDGLDYLYGLVIGDGVQNLAAYAEERQLQIAGPTFDGTYESDSTEDAFLLP
jgi:hypothetical protein